MLKETVRLKVKCKNKNAVCMDCGTENIIPAKNSDNGIYTYFKSFCKKCGEPLNNNTCEILQVDAKIIKRRIKEVEPPQIFDPADESIYRLKPTA